MKRLVAVRLFESKADACDRCGMDMDKDNKCCHDELKVVKTVNEQNRIPIVLFDLTSFYFTSFSVSDFISLPVLNGESSISCQGHSPPLISQQDNYLFYQVFRI